MEDLILIIVFALALTILVFLFSTKSKNRKSSTPKEDGLRPFMQHSKEYALQSKHSAVTISHDIDACDAVKEIGHTRLLVRDAPILPLKNCTKSTTCDCHYLHHTDRRTSNRRDESVESNERKAKLRNSE